MDNDLISRSALLDGGIRVQCGYNLDDLIMIPMRDVRKSIKEAPAVDAVVVIRCEDCAFMCPGNVYPVCTNWGRNTDRDGWCYLAERREDNDV